MSPSSHDADERIIVLAAGDRASAHDRELILGRIREAGFGPRRQSLGEHLERRVRRDRQWAHSATPATYLDDLQRATSARGVRLGVFRDRGGAIAVVIAPTAEVLDIEQRGTRWLEWLVVVYAADRATIITGYQFSALSTIRIAEGVQWLQ